MSFTAEIFNYKTIKHETITIDGYTLLVGKNFIGKSAAIHAIVAALQNAEGDGFIRHGEKYCEVRLNFEKSSIIWHKEKGNNFYVIEHEGQLYDLKKIGRGDIPQPLKDMGFSPIVVSNEKVHLWYAPQFEPLFLINRTRQNFSTDIIASVTKMDAIYKASDLAKKELSKQNSALKTRRTDLLDAQEKIKLYAPLEEYDALSEKTQEDLQAVVILKTQISDISRISKDYEEGVVQERLLSPVDGLEPLDTQKVSILKGVRDTVTLLDTEYSVASSEYVDTLSKFQELEEHPKEALKTAQILLQDIVALNALISTIQSAQVGYEGCKGVGDAKDVTPYILPIDGCLSNLKTLKVLEAEYLAAYAEFVKTKGTLDAIGPNTDTAGLRSLVETVITLESLVTSYEDSISTFTAIEKGLQETIALQEINTKELSEFKECPSCRRTL